MFKKLAIILLVFWGLIGVSLFLSKRIQVCQSVVLQGSNEIAKSRKIQSTDCKKVALTFDDGPHPVYTEQLLDGLKDRGVHASFFVTGEHAALHPEIIKRMQEDGHLIGNHTYSHMQLRKDNRDAYKAELEQTNGVLEEITGQETVFVRPPYGSWDKQFETELNMIPVLWSVDPLDWCSGSAACVEQRILANVSDGDIILLHDYYDTSVTAALTVVDALLEEGYEFVTVDEMLFD